MSIFKSTQFNALLYSLKKCEECKKLVKSRQQVMGKCNYPLPPSYKTDATYFLIGIAPGRLQSKFKRQNEEDRAFKYASGRVLERVLKLLKIDKQCYITNIVKCNTPDDGQFLKCDVKQCIRSFLIKEIAMVKPKKIVVMGYQAHQYFRTYLYDAVYKHVTGCIYFIKHPSYISRVPSYFKKYVEEWRKII